MHNIVEIDPENVLGVECSGKMTAADIEGIHNWLNVELTKKKRPAVVIFMSDFSGYADLRAFWEDLKMETKHRHDVSRVAIVADQTWVEKGAPVVDFVTSVDLKWFSPADRKAAVNWAGMGS